MDWREQQREGNERLRKRAEDDRRQREEMIRRMQEDARRRSEEAKRLQERREDQKRAEKLERQHREENNRTREALDRQTQAIERGSEIRHVARDTAQMDQVTNKDNSQKRIQFEKAYERVPKPHRRFRSVWIFTIIFGGLLIFWAAAGIKKVEKLFANQSQLTSSTEQPRAADTSPRRETTGIKRPSKTKPILKVYPPCTATRVDQCTQ